MGWANSAITNNGNAMLNQSLVGHVLTITHVVGGAGILDPSELTSASAVADEKQKFNLLGIENVDGGKKIKIQITNKDVVEKYVLHQVAVYARLDDEPETSLLFIMQDELGVEIPTPAETPDFIFEMYATIGISNTANVKVNVDSDISVTVQYLNDTLRNHDANKNAHPHLLQMIWDAYNSVLAQVGGIKKIIKFTVPVSGWLPIENPKNGYLYYYDLSSTDITEDMIPEIVLAEESLDTATQCGMCSTAVSYDGYVRLKCMQVPTAEIIATCNLVVESGAAENASTVLSIPIASATTVGGIKSSDTIFIDEDGTAHVVNVNGSGNVATDDEVNDAVEDIFGTPSHVDAEIASDEDVEEVLTEIFGADNSAIASDGDVTQMLTDIFGS